MYLVKGQPGLYMLLMNALSQKSFCKKANTEQPSFHTMSD